MQRFFCDIFHRLTWVAEVLHPRFSLQLFSCLLSSSALYFFQLRGFFLFAPILLQFAIAEDLIWCSAQLPHSSKPDM